MAKAIQFKVTLKGIAPEIWRRFVVRDDITFQQLHEAIQAVMGWENYHLYQFHVGDLCFEEPDPESLADGEDEMGVAAEKVLDHVSIDDKTLAYLYDFGDCWEHKLEIENVLDGGEFGYIPCCVGGERACPPEDCGGVRGYEHLLKVRADKKHEEYRELIVDWLDEDYDPESFSVDEADERLNDPDYLAEDDDDETIDEDDFVPLGELLLEDTPEAKKIKDLKGMEANYLEYLFTVEDEVMNNFLADRKLTDKDVIEAIENVKKNYLNPLDSFDDGLEMDIMLGLSSALQDESITHHELKLVFNHVLWAIDNRSWLGDSQAYVKWLPHYFNLYSDEEDERYVKNFTQRARRIGVPKVQIDAMLERDEDCDCCDDDDEVIAFDDLRFDSENEEDNKKLFKSCFVHDPDGFRLYIDWLEEKGDSASVENVYRVAMEIIDNPLIEFAFGVSYARMGNKKLARHHIENSIKNIEGMPEDELDGALGIMDRKTILSQMKQMLGAIGE